MDEGDRLGPGPVIRVVDPLQIAQARFERYCKAHAVYVAGDDEDLDVAEVAALIAIAGALRTLTTPEPYRRMVPPVHIPRTMEQGSLQHTCFPVQDAGGGRTVEGRETCPACRAKG
jgi:hypothetical protein